MLIGLDFRIHYPLFRVVNVDTTAVRKAWRNRNTNSYKDITLVGIFNVSLSIVLFSTCHGLSSQSLIASGGTKVVMCESIYPPYQGILNGDYLHSDVMNETARFCRRAKCGFIHDVVAVRCGFDT